jgi:uncharacterized protein (DUF952 family)
MAGPHPPSLSPPPTYSQSPLGIFSISPLCSHIAQIPITSDLFFTGVHTLWILKLRLSDFDPSKVKWDEVEGTNGCPHLYGNFGADDVESVREFRREADETWIEALKGDEWLE